MPELQGPTPQLEVRHSTAYDVHRGQAIGQIAPKTGIEPLTNLVAQVMTTEPYASARRMFWVVDNGSPDNGQCSIDRMDAAWPTATLVHLSVHASWLNQVEIFFSILQRKAITPADFTNLDDLAERILAFQARYNATARPFDRTYTRHDLNAYLTRLDQHVTSPALQQAAVSADREVLTLVVNQQPVHLPSFYPKLNIGIPPFTRIVPAIHPMSVGI